MEKRGQATIFVIVGIILVIIVGLAIYLSSQTKIKQVPVEQTYQQEYDNKVLPIANDVKFCLAKLSEDALVTIGTRGGYLNSSLAWKHNLYPEYSDTALEVFKDSGYVVPYWYYIDGAPTCTDCKMVIDIPPLQGSDPNSIQSQVQSYVDDNILSCMNNFEGYQQNFEVKWAKPRSYMLFRDKDTFVGMDWPINITFRDGTTLSMQKYNSIVDLKMQKIYDLAASVLYQMEIMGPDRKFEDFTSSLLNYYSLGGDNALIPPVVGPTQIGFVAPKIWQKTQVKQIMKDAIAENINYMQVFGSKDSYYLFDDNNSMRQNTYSNFQNIVYADKDFLGATRIRFDYLPSFPMYLDVSPSLGEIVMPESSFINLFFFQIGLAKYRFFYDVDYPVLVTLEDDSALNGKGYTLQYAFEVNVRKNTAYTNKTFSLDISSITQADENNRSEFGTINQRSVPVRIKVINGYDFTPYEGVQVSYTCIDKTILVGESKTVNGESIIGTSLPPCIDGEFEIINFNISGEKVVKTLALGKSYDFDYYVYPEKVINVNLKKLNLQPTSSVSILVCQSLRDDDAQLLSQKVAECMNSANVNPFEANYSGERSWQLSTGSGQSNMIDDEQAIVMLTKNGVPDSANGLKFVLINGTNPSAEIAISPGEYKLEIISLLHIGENYTYKNIKIVRREFETPDDFWSAIGLSDGTTVRIPEVIFNQTLFLGYILLDNSTTGFFNITPQDLINSNSLTLTYASYDPSALLLVEDLNVLGLLQSTSKNYPGQFDPKFE